MNIRNAGKEDLDGIMGLVARLVDMTDGYWDEEYPAREHFEESLAHDGLYVAEKDGRIIATCGIEPAEGVFAELDCWSKNHKKPCTGSRLGVDPDYQGRHIPDKIISFALEDSLRRHSYDSMHFLVARCNTRAINVYDREGFRRVGEAKFFDVDFYCYECELPFVIHKEKERP